jgi:hypothetical protein
MGFSFYSAFLMLGRYDTIRYDAIWYGIYLSRTGREIGRGMFSCSKIPKRSIHTTG